MRSLEARLQKLEANRPSHDQHGFFVFGRTREEIRALRSVEESAGRAPREAYRCDVLWRGPGPVPAPRLAHVDNLTEEEVEDYVATCCAWIGRAPSPRGDAAYFQRVPEIIAALRAEMRPPDPHP